MKSSAITAAGYYSAAPSAAGNVTTRRNGQCTRCPVGTYQPAVGATDHLFCVACDSGTVDDDQDPTEDLLSGDADLLDDDFAVRRRQLPSHTRPRRR